MLARRSDKRQGMLPREMRVTVLYFAAAREKAGLAEEPLELLEGARAADLRAAIATRHPALAPLLPRMRLAVNRELCEDARALAAGDEVAVIPPVAGGAELHRLLDSPLDPAEVIARVGGPDQGGICTFIGAVRGTARDGRRVLRLEYEAYPAMVLDVFDAIARDCAARFGATVAIDHRTGTVLAGGLAVVIAASAPHRAECFEACRHAIDRLKHEAPIWKREVYADGSVWVGMGP